MQKRHSRVRRGAPPPPGPGDRIPLAGQRLGLERHPTDFTVLGALRGGLRAHEVEVRTLAPAVRRGRTAAPAGRDSTMESLRRRGTVHHVYRIAETGEEILLDDRILVRLREDDPAALERICGEFYLVHERQIGGAHLLRLTAATGYNPIKTANAIARRRSVESCSPQLLVELRHTWLPNPQTQRLYAEQWYLDDAVSAEQPDLQPGAGIRLRAAWEFLGHAGDQDVVVAIIDDGFDLGHPAFHGARIHPERRNFGAAGHRDDPSPRARDAHGTPVASLALGSLAGGAMVGVAPGCTFLPIRMDLGMARPTDVLAALEYASERADVANCSFATPPRSVARVDPSVREAIAELARTGGRRGRGLTIVLAAGNDDAPTALAGAANRNGVRYVDAALTGYEIADIPAGAEVTSDFLTTAGVVVVASSTSLRRKAGYSGWGPHVALAAPSNNLHFIPRRVRRAGNEAVWDSFAADYRGLGQIAAQNRSRTEREAPAWAGAGTPPFAESQYLRDFGGTSGAAPIVSGVAALVLSAYPDLAASAVLQILVETADQGLDPTPDLADDPNLQGLSGAFVDGRSLFYGAGKVDALRAVQRARELQLAEDVP